MNSTKMIDWIDNDIYLYIKDFIIKLKNFLLKYLIINKIIKIRNHFLLINK